MTTEIPAAPQRLGGLTGVRESLAVQRSRLANERTLLAYIRTALVFLVVGMALVQFFSGAPVNVLGWVLLGLGGVVAGLGGWKFLRVRRHILQFATHHST